MSTEAEIWAINLGVAGLIIGTIAIILAVFIPFLVERLRRPDLIVTLSPNLVTNDSPRFLHGRVTNRPHAHLKWIDRNRVLHF